jgi:hypothetical protein
MEHFSSGGLADLPAAGFAVAQGDGGGGGDDQVKEGLSDGHSDVVLFLFVAIGAGDAAAIGLEGVDGEAGDKGEQVEGGQADVVGAELAGGVIRDLSLDRLEIGFE